MIQKSIHDVWSHHNCGFIISAVIMVSSQCLIMVLTWHVKNPRSLICSCHWWFVGFESHVTLSPDPPHSMCTSAAKLQLHNCHLESWDIQEGQNSPMDHYTTQTSSKNRQSTRNYSLWTYFTFLNFPGNINEVWKHNQQKNNCDLMELIQDPLDPYAFDSLL